jgi:hemolysin III
LSTSIELHAIRRAALPMYAPPAVVDGTCPPEIHSVDRVEELANSITHGAGVVLSSGGLSALVRINSAIENPWHAVGCIIYGVSLVLLYSASTLYHGCRHPGRKRVLLLLDHIGIYLLIAGTCTPLALIPLHGRLGSALLVLVWASALAGSLAKISRIDRLDEDSPWSYLALSWMALATTGEIAVNIPPGVLAWLLAGGVFYTMGLPFFLQRDRRFHHAIWHLFVLAGSICHYRAVLGVVG